MIFRSVRGLKTNFLEKPTDQLNILEKRTEHSAYEVKFC